MKPQRAAGLTLAGVALLALLSAGPAFGQATTSDPVAGRVLAADLCSNCHLVDEGQTGPVTDGVPAFAVLARDPATTDRSLRAFIVDPHPPMPQITLTATEIDAIVAYIRSLAPAQ